MPGTKGKRSARRCIDGCGSTNSKTIARHKREWKSLVNVKPTRFAAQMSHLSSRAHGLPDMEEPSNLGEPTITKSSRVASQNLLPQALIPRSLHLGTSFDGEHPPSESEHLTSASLSAYDCDSEGEDSGYDVDSDDSDDGMRETCKPGLTNLRFQLNAVKAGGCCDPYLTDPR